MYDEIHHKDARFYLGEIDYESAKRTKGPQPLPESKPPRNLFYNEADALEDEILFPEEHSTEMVLRASDVSKVSPLEAWVEGGFDMQKWVEGWESDTDFDSRSGSDSEMDDDDYDDDYDEDDEEEDDHDNSDEKYGHSLVTRDGALDHLDPPDVVKDLLRKVMSSATARRSEEPDVEEEFFEYLDKEKAKSMSTISIYRVRN